MEVGICGVVGEEEELGSRSKGDYSKAFSIINFTKFKWFILLSLLSVNQKKLR
jgi:hypothetical protein